MNDRLVYNGDGRENPFNIGENYLVNPCEKAKEKCRRHLMESKMTSAQFRKYSQEK